MPSLATHYFEGARTESSAPGSAVKDEGSRGPVVTKSSRPKKIWIDLENSPHIPFFKPIIGELERRGYTVVLTARDCFQVRELADLFGLQYRMIGRHYGKHRLSKLAGLAIRTVQMAKHILRQKPDLAVSHGSRSLFLLSSLLKIPSITITDYEHASWIGAFQRSWVMAPDVIPKDVFLAKGYKEDQILRYPGIKEDVYAPSFLPDATVRQRLSLSDQDLVVTIRPPATEAHYHNPESSRLLDAVFETIAKHPDAKVVLLPRTPRQEADLSRQWPELFKTGRVIVPVQAVDGLGLIWFSDLVISGGGTMNREAAALGVPVYSTFRGKMGAVDEDLAKKGRLVLLQSAEDVRSKLKLTRRTISGHLPASASPTLQAVVDHVCRIVEAEAD
jgi:predicted glycosyltransferase